MKTPHFFKAYSRLGAIYKLIRQDHYISGVEDGPDYILTPNFLKSFPEHQVSEFSFSSPDKIPRDRYYEILAKELENFSNQINQKIKKGQTQVVIGGDNTVTFSSMRALLERVSDTQDIGYVQFDSHGEMHLYLSSISKNFHGMYMRPFVDKFDIEVIEKLVPRKIDISQAFAVGDIIYDEGDDGPNGEVEIYKKIRNVRRVEFLKNKSNVLKEFEKFTKRFKYLHINFDIDVFDGSVAGATGEDEGVWLWQEVYVFLDIISKHPNIAFDLVEFNPHMGEASKRTAKVSQDILSLILNL